MRFLKLKYIVSYMIILAVIIVALLYFVGGLTVTTLEKDNLTFDETGFINFNSGQTDDIGDPIEVTYDHDKIVAENDTYALIIDEETTIARVVDKRTCT
ncbi:MAG: hypothetical protein WCQ80_02365, partial [Bacilli bacterium]